MSRKGVHRRPEVGEKYVSMDPRDPDRVVQVTDVGSTHATVCCVRSTRVRLDNFYEAGATLRSGYRHMP